MATKSQSNTRRLVEVLMKGQLEPLVRRRRSEGVAWRRIAKEIDAQTGVDVAGETLRVWFEDDLHDEARAG